MKDNGLLEFKSYLGNLQAGNDIVPVTYRIRIDEAGEVKFDFDSITLTNETSFIMQRWGGDGARLGHFSLVGKAEDDTEFKTDDLYFTSLAIESHPETGSRMSPVGGCLHAEFRRKLAMPAAKPMLRMRVKGFQNSGRLNSKCRLGMIAMDGDNSIDNPDTITGYIAVQADNVPFDLTAWQAEADKLLEHIRNVMSFASAIILKRPIIEFCAGDDLLVVTCSQTRQSSAFLRIFYHSDQQPVFDAAVNSFFAPPFDVKNLFFAIEWFAMEATYNEVRLVNAMTALENFVASNLDKNKKAFFSSSQFKKIAHDLRLALKEAVGKIGVSSDDSMLDELYKKLPDVNRRSIIQKVELLAIRWSVPLDGIDIEGAIKARNSIVHEGFYYDSGKVECRNLGEYVAIVREVVARLLLAAIGYRGNYISHIDGYHDAQFPPVRHG